MANMDKQQVSSIAALARLSVSDEESALMAKQCGEILGFISELNEISATATEPKVGSVYNVMREDQQPHEPGMYTDALLKEMPKTKNGMLVVKKIL